MNRWSRRAVFPWLAVTALAAACGGGGGGGTPIQSAISQGGSGSEIESTNFAGYQVTRGPGGFNRVGGSWTVPSVPGSKTDTASSTWVGIGGSCANPPGCTLVEPTLIQAGTEQDSTGGQPSYFAWFEALPGPAVQASGGPLSTQSFDVKPGDAITASIDGSTLVAWMIAITDVRDGQTHWTFNTTVPYVAAGFTAEWIVEAPLVFGAGGAGQIALSDFGRVSFSALTANGANPNLGSAGTRIVLTDGNRHVLANPSSPPSGGNAFDVCFGAAACD